MNWARTKNTKEKLLTPRPCPFCEKPMSRAFLIARNKRRGERISASLKAAIENGTGPVGRPKTRDDEAIKRLRLQGKSIRQIAKELGCSTWSVQRGMRS